MGEFRLLIAKLASKNASFKEELISIKNISSVKSAQTSYGFFNNVLMLEIAIDVTKSRVTGIISQMRNPLFKRHLGEVIHTRAKRFINFDFLQHDYAKSQEEFDSWSDAKYIDELEFFFQNEHLDTNTLSRFVKIVLGGLFVTGKISAALINSLLEAIELMTHDEGDDVVLQKSLINRAFNHLSPPEPARIKLTTEVSKCKTFKEFLLL
jgi:hypothetical protein